MVFNNSMLHQSIVRLVRETKDMLYYYTEFGIVISHPVVISKNCLKFSDDLFEVVDVKETPTGNIYKIGNDFVNIDNDILKKVFYVKDEKLDSYEIFHFNGNINDYSYDNIIERYAK